MARKFLISRIALAVALSSGLAMAAAPGAALAKESKDKDKGPKIEFSPAFSKAAAELDKTLGEGPKNAALQAALPKVQGAKTDADKAAAVAEVDAALGGAKAKLDASTAAATTPGDKLKLGEMTRTYGIYTGNLPMQKQGLVMMLDSGVASPASLGQIQYLAGAVSFNSRDFADAAKYFQMAVDSGFKDESGQLSALLSESYKRSNNTGAALAVAKKEIDAALASGGKPSETALRTALQAAYDAKQADAATDYAVALARSYPSQKSWGDAITVVRAISKLQQPAYIDLMRLMDRTNSFATNVDYVEFLQVGTTKGLAKEVLAVTAKGKAAGVLKDGDTLVREATKAANDRIAKDTAEKLLPSYERDARSPSASLVTLMGAAESFQTYGEAAKAEEFYKLALAKPGVDRDGSMLRLGIAQSDQGKFADAKATFDQVGGAAAPVAKLWSAYASTKLAGGVQ